MNPIYLTQRLKGALIRYLLTTFDVNRDGENAALHARMRATAEADSALVTGPFLELTEPYETGLSIRQLVEAGTLSPKMLSVQKPPIPFDATLYQHQQRATERIAEGHSVIVSSGTGSGKTESFMIPILNDLLQRPAQGVRAVLIYPLNALVNDQLARLEKLLTGTDITFGRYTSELVDKTSEWQKKYGRQLPSNQIISRQQIREEGKIPNILITNYAMLEYLLMRPEDSKLFSRPDDWQFIVLDEAHSYSGAKGIEVAYLIRRLKQRLGKERGQMTCIGTSATLTDDAAQAIQFAETLFGETFAEDDIIFGQTQAEQPADVPAYSPAFEAYLRDEVADLLEKLRTDTLTVDDAWDRLSGAGLVDQDNANLSSLNDVGALLHGALHNNAHLLALRRLLAERGEPVNITEAARALFPAQQGTEDEQADALRALYHMVELGAMARPTPDSAALLPARYHLFARSPQGMWACLNPECAGRPAGHAEPWSRLFGSPRLVCDSCQCAVYPLSVCRTCGQVFVHTHYGENQHHTDVDLAGSTQQRYFAWKKAAVNAGLGDEADDDEDGGPRAKTAHESATPTQFEETATHLCVNATCRRDSRCTCATPRRVALYAVIEKQTGVKGSKTQRVSELRSCPRCGSQSRIKDDEIATEITLRGTTPLAVLTMELYRNLPEAPEPEMRRLPGGGRKLLTFYDSRQGAARYAAFLQDIHGQDVYRFLVPRALEALHAQHGDTIAFDELAQATAETGWKEGRAFQNLLDDQLDELLQQARFKDWDSFASAEKRTLKRYVQANLLAEFTTKRRGRQSLESLGLVAVRYFEQPPDVAALADNLGLSAEQTRAVIDYLLETLRTEKVIELPDGVERDHPAFGAHKGNSRVAIGSTGSSDAPWIGKTEKHVRCRIMRLALEAAGQPADFAAVQRGLRLIWEWLTDRRTGRGVLAGEDGSYRLSLAHLFVSAPASGWVVCDHCQRVRHGSGVLPCPAKHCGGAYQPFERGAEEEANFYHYVRGQGLTPMRVEEHTAQLTSEKGQDYQNLFKSGAINVLSCSTTFEMGIDLGDLQAVVLNNVPPNVANYRQRAGRAGRRAGGTAFIVTWAREQPHDQVYYANPPEIIRGQVRVPRLKLDSPEIRRRHLNALLLGDFLRYLVNAGAGSVNTVGPFFDPQAAAGRHYDQLDAWWGDRQHDLAEALKEISHLIAPAGVRLSLDDVAKTFAADLAQAEAHYRAASDVYIKQMDEALAQMQATRDSKATAELADNRKDASRRLERLSEEYLVDYLSGRGALPSYAFPLYTVELELPIEKAENAKLRLNRDLSRAITEFAPGAEVVADKRLWRSAGVRYLKDAPQVYDYRICPTCNHIEVGTGGDDGGAGKPIPGKPILIEQCPICGNGYKGKMSSAQYLVPDAFRMDARSGQPAGQYVRRDMVVQNFAVRIPSTAANVASGGAAVTRAVQRGGTLFSINAGLYEMGYTLCGKCGRSMGAKDKVCKVCGGAPRQLHLGHHVPTDSLLLQFSSLPHVTLPGKIDLDFWLTLLSALVLGASRALQIERSDINGALFPVTYNQDWQRALVLYDAVPGGAGYMEDIDAHFAEVVEAALSLARCPNCSEDTACTRCLRDYNNQKFYHNLKRGKVIPVLEGILASLRGTDNALGIMPLVANNPIDVLWEQVANARFSVQVAAEAISLMVPPGKTENWLDLLHDRLRAGLEVEVLLNQVPSPTRTSTHEELIAARHLLLMLSTGQKLILRQTDAAMPSWHLLVDAGHERQRAFQFEAPPRLGEPIHRPHVQTTARPEGIQAAQVDFAAAFARARTMREAGLQPPPSTQVSLIAASGRKTTEADIDALRAFYGAPVRELLVNDPFLLDRERIVKRLGAHVRLAAAGGALARVQVITRDANLENADRAAQRAAFDQLEAEFPQVEFAIKRLTNRQEHDRSLAIVRADGSRSRLFIGRGLDFIRADGTVQATYIVTEELVP